MRCAMALVWPSMRALEPPLPWQPRPSASLACSFHAPPSRWFSVGLVSLHGRIWIPFRPIWHWISELRFDFVIDVRAGSDLWPISYQLIWWLHQRCLNSRLIYWLRFKLSEDFQWEIWFDSYYYCVYLLTFFFLKVSSANFWLGWTIYAPLHLAMMWSFGSCN